MADNSQRRAGLERFWIGGTEEDVVGEISYGVATVTRTSLPGRSTVHGYKEEVKPGFIELTIRDSRGRKVADFQEFTNVQASLELGNGKRITGAGMWTTEAVEVSADEATFKLRLEGRDVKET